MAKLEVKTLSVEQLKADLVAAEQQYETLRFSHATSPLESNPLQLRTLRRNIARYRTALREREMAEQVSNGTLPQRDKIRTRRRREKKISK